MHDSNAVKQLLAQVLMAGGEVSNKTHPNEFLIQIHTLKVPEKFLHPSALSAGSNCPTCGDKKCRAKNMRWEITDSGKDFVKS
jgi:hypothetical protein